MKTRKALLAKYLTLVLSTFLIISCGTDEENTAKVVQSHLERSNAYQQQGQFRAAIIEARNIIKKDRKNNMGYLRLAEIYTQLGNHKAASNLIEAIPTPNAESQILLVEAFVGQRKYTSAQKALDEYEFQGGDKNTEQYKLMELQILASKNKAEETGTILLEIAQQSPGNIEAQNLLTRFYIGQKQFKDADNLIEKTLKKAPNDPATLALASQLAYLKNDLPTAETHLTNALLELPETDLILPIRSQVLRQLSSVLTEQGRTTEALAYAKLLAQSNPEGTAARSQFKQALKALSEGNTEEAEEILQEIYKKFPSNTMVALYLGLIDYQQGDFSSASELLSNNIDIEISSAQVIQATALSLLRQNKISEAQQLLQEAIATHPYKAKLLALYGLTSLQNELTQEDGLLAIQRSLAMNPKMYSLRLALARHYFSKANTEQAQAQLELVLKEEPGHILATALHAQIFEATGKQSEADKAINTMLMEKPNDFSAINLAARYALAHKDNELAEKRFTQSIEAEPENPEAIASLASMSMQGGDYPQAKIYYNILIEKAPNNPAGYKGLITAMEANGQADTAIDSLIKIATLDDNIQATAAAVTAEYYLRKGNTKKAVPFIEKAIAKEQTPYIKGIAFQAAIAKAQEAVLAEDWATARKILVESAANANSTLRVESLLADVETRSGNFQEADQLIQKLLTDHPTDLAPIFAKVKLLDAQKMEQRATSFIMSKWNETHETLLGNAIYSRLINDNEQASKFLTEWKAQNFNTPEPYIYSALHAQKTDSKRAISDYEKALSIKPNSATVLNNLAWLYHETSNPKAESTAKQAYELAPESAAIMDTYGWIMVENGRIDEGITMLKRALALSPPNIKSEITEHLIKAQRP